MTRLLFGVVQSVGPAVGGQLYPPEDDLSGVRTTPGSRQGLGPLVGHARAAHGRTPRGGTVRRYAGHARVGHGTQAHGRARRLVELPDTQAREYGVVPFALSVFDAAGNEATGTGSTLVISEPQDVHDVQVGIAAGVVTLTVTE